MQESERLIRLKAHAWTSEDPEMERQIAETSDNDFSTRILGLLNHPDIDKTCMVDAYYYDSSAIPFCIQENTIGSDCYLIFGITTEGEMVTKWVLRWDLDSNDPIVDGKVIHSEKKYNARGFVSPEMRKSFDAKLLSVPCPNFEWVEDPSTSLHPADFEKVRKYYDAKLLAVPSLHFKCVTEEELQ